MYWERFLWLGWKLSWKSRRKSSFLRFSKGIFPGYREAAEIICLFSPFIRHRIIVNSMQFSNLQIPCEQFVLDNGLHVIVHEDHKTPIVAVNIWYHVGSKNEKPSKTGFAHLFEHLMFGGS